MTCIEIFRCTLHQNLRQHHNGKRKKVAREKIVCDFRWTRKEFLIRHEEVLPTGNKVKGLDTWIKIQSSWI